MIYNNPEEFGIPDEFCLNERTIGYLAAEKFKKIRHMSDNISDSSLDEIDLNDSN
jgi:hypothetical protein